MPVTYQVGIEADPWSPGACAALNEGHSDRLAVISQVLGAFDISGVLASTYGFRASFGHASKSENLVYLPKCTFHFCVCVKITPEHVVPRLPFKATKKLVQ